MSEIRESHHSWIDFIGGLTFAVLVLGLAIAGRITLKLLQIVLFIIAIPIGLAFLLFLGIGVILFRILILPRLNQQQRAELCRPD